MNKGVENFFIWVYISANEIKFIKKEISFMRLSNIKKVVVSVGLALGLVSGSMVAFGAPSHVITPGQSTAATALGGVNSQVIENGNKRIVIVGEGQEAPSHVITPGQSTVVTNPGGVNSQVIEDGNTRIVIVGEGQKAPSQVITPGAATNTQIRRATYSNATVSNATRSNASSSSSSSSRGRSSGSSYGGGSARPVSTNNTNTTNNVGPNGNSYNSNTANTNTRNVGPAGANNNGATKGDVTAAKRGRLNVPKTADASAMGLYAALLGLSAVGGALVVATKKKEN
ncbi:sortase B cell surface sorting signal [Lachnospiraceae bacterium oral taxon 082 str. F0431]|nr:sortase B cell surface sorting signal [Lachnospiraceae bacterium oral taxon 082 str. F0431]